MLFDNLKPLVRHGGTLWLTVPRHIAKFESVTHGNLAFKQTSPTTAEFSLPLENNDFVKLWFD